MKEYDRGYAARAPEIIVIDDPAELADVAARAIVDAALEAVKARGRFMISLAGGGTPRTTYRATGAVTAPREDAVGTDVDLLR